MTKLSSLLTEKTPKYELKIPSTGKIVTYRPFLVKEEKILLIAQESQSNEEILLAIRDIVESCVDGLTEVDNMPIFDIEYIFLRIRSKSVGELVTPTIVCPETEESVELEIDLLSVEPTKEENHTNKIQISDDILVKMRYPSLGLLRKRNSMLDINDSASFYDLIVECIDEIHTEKEVIKSNEVSKNEIASFVDVMNKSQFNSLLDFFLTSPRLEYTTKYTTKDGVERSITLSGLGDFFG
ncbi:baseplate protein [archaeon]|nr:baseplate protein [archaeon]